MEVLDLFKPLSEIPELDTSYFQPWTLDKLYQVEPELEAIAALAVAQKRRRWPARRAAQISNDWEFGQKDRPWRYQHHGRQRGPGKPLNLSKPTLILRGGGKEVKYEFEQSKSADLAARDCASAAR